MGQFWNADDADDADGAVNEVASMLEESGDEESTDEAGLEADVERRIEVVSLYKLILNGSFFQEDTAAARIVTGRLRKFVTSEVKQLLGMEAPSPAQAQNSFDAEQTEALKRVADKVLGRNTPPALRQVAPPAPVVQALKQRPAPPVQKLVTKPQQSPPTPQIKPAAPPTTPKAGKRVRQVQAKFEPVLVEVTKEDVSDDKKIFRKTEEVNGRLIQTYLDSRGQVVGKPKDASPQIRPTDALPMPNPHQVGMIMEQQSVSTINAGISSTMEGPSESAAGRVGVADLAQLALRS